MHDKRRYLADRALLDALAGHEFPAKPHPHALQHRFEHQIDLVESHRIGGRPVAQPLVAEPVLPVQAVPGRSIQLNQRQGLQRLQRVDRRQGALDAGDRVDGFVEQLVGLE
ncbi:hypothetical protein D3C84_774240 [compost metagenome]